MNLQALCRAMLLMEKSVLFIIFMPFISDNFAIISFSIFANVTQQRKGNAMFLFFCPQRAKKFSFLFLLLNTGNPLHLLLCEMLHIYENFYFLFLPYNSLVFFSFY